MGRVTCSNCLETDNRRRMISDNISWIVTYPAPHTWWGALRYKALKAKIALEGVAEQAMPTDLAQRHEVLPGPVLGMEELNYWTRRPGL